MNFRRLLSAIICIFLACSARAIKPDRNYIRLPQNIGMIYRKLDVVTEDGCRIETWFYPAQDFPEPDAGSSSMLPYRILDNERRPTLIICNGDAGNMSYQQIGLASIYTANGFNVVTFDWRGFGGSSEYAMDENCLCHTGMLLDYEAVVRAVKKQKEVDKKRIFLMGWSTGAYLSMITAYENRNVAGCILSGTPTSFEDVIPVLAERHPDGKTADDFIVPDDFPRELMPGRLASEFRKPIFIIVGAEDDRTPLWMSEKIYNAVPEGVCKKLSIYENAGHGGTSSPYIVDTRRWIEETVGFMKDVPVERGRKMSISSH